nr:hypothetical protein [Tanacetum cinerariifolium]
MQHKLQELIDLCTRLQRQQDEMALKITAHDLEIATLKARIKHLEDRDKGDDDPFGEDTTIKGRRLETGEEAEVATVSVPPATISVPTGSDVVPTASPIFTTATMARQLEKEMAKAAQRMNEQIARDAKIARIHVEEELQIMIDGLDRNNETVAKYLQEYEQFAVELSIGERKKEGERFKRKGLSLEHDSAKKVKTSEEVSEEDLKEMMHLVPVKEVYVEALQGRFESAIGVSERNSQHQTSYNKRVVVLPPNQFNKISKNDVKRHGVDVKSECENVPKIVSDDVKASPVGVDGNVDMTKKVDVIVDWVAGCFDVNKIYDTTLEGPI